VFVSLARETTRFVGQRKRAIVRIHAKEFARMEYAHALKEGDHRSAIAKAIVMEFAKMENAYAQMEVFHQSA